MVRVLGRAVVTICPVMCVYPLRAPAGFLRCQGSCCGKREALANKLLHVQKSMERIWPPFIFPEGARACMTELENFRASCSCFLLNFSFFNYFYWAASFHAPAVKSLITVISGGWKQANAVPELVCTGQKCGQGGCANICKNSRQIGHGLTRKSPSPREATEGEKCELLKALVPLWLWEASEAAG